MQTDTAEYERHQRNLQVFESLQSSIDDEVARRERIRDAVRDLDSLCRTLTAHLNGIHAVPSSQFDTLVVGAQRYISQCHASLQALAGLLPRDQYWRYSDMFSRSMQTLAFNVVLMSWIGNDDLADIKTTSQIMAINDDWELRLSTEDYLHGVITLVNELARLCPNSIVNSDFALPLRISKFCKEIHAGFGMLNLKNDSLRKRFDGMKYDIKKIEEVVYDISLRGLVPSAAGSALQNTAETATSNKRVRDDVHL